MVISLSQNANSKSVLTTLTNVDSSLDDPISVSPSSSSPPPLTDHLQMASSSSLSVLPQSDLPTHLKPTRLKQNRPNSIDINTSNIATDGSTTADNDLASPAVVLRTKSYSTMVLPNVTTSSKLLKTGNISGITSTHHLDRSYSMPVVEAQRDETAKSASTAAPIGLNQIAEIRSFLESDYIPDEYWHLQRDSFIHRSYNEKLVARKNAQDQSAAAAAAAAGNTTKKAVATRPVSMGGLPAAAVDGDVKSALVVATEQPIQRMSFIRHSLNTIRRSFSTKNYQKQKIVSNVKKSKQPQSGSEVDSGNNNSDVEKVRAAVAGERLNVHSFIRNGHSRNSSTSSCKSNR